MVNMWQRILSRLQHKINRQSFNTWLKPTRQLSFAEGMLNVEVPSLLFADWISRNYLPLIQESAREIEAGELHLHFTSRPPGVSARPAAGSASLAGGGVLSEGRAHAEGARVTAMTYGDPAPPRGA